jgi:hypothetical protein
LESEPAPSLIGPIVGEPLFEKGGYLVAIIDQVGRAGRLRPWYVTSISFPPAKFFRHVEVERTIGAPLTR